MQGESLTWVRIFDQVVYPTLGLLRIGGAPGDLFLARAIDTRGRETLFELRSVPTKLAEETLVSLDKGSCDVRRANAEIDNLQSQSAASDWLLKCESAEPTGLYDLTSRAVQAAYSAGFKKGDGQLLGALDQVRS
ncbi:MAG: hypothetical protein AAF529_22190 [Pseudomonadota bacterium]